MAKNRKQDDLPYDGILASIQDLLHQSLGDIIQNMISSAKSVISKATSRATTDIPEPGSPTFAQTATKQTDTPLKDRLTHFDETDQSLGGLANTVQDVQSVFTVFRNIITGLANRFSDFASTLAHPRPPLYNQPLSNALYIPDRELKVPYKGPLSPVSGKETTLISLFNALSRFVEGGPKGRSIADTIISALPLTKGEQKGLQEALSSKLENLADISSLMSNVMSAQFARARTLYEITAPDKGNVGLASTPLGSRYIESITSAFDNQIYENMSRLASRTKSQINRLLEAYSHISTKYSMVFDADVGVMGPDAGASGYLKMSPFRSYETTGLIMRDISRNLDAMFNIQMAPKIQRDTMSAIKGQTMLHVTGVAGELYRYKDILPERLVRPLEETFGLQRRYTVTQEALAEREERYEKLKEEQETIQERLTGPEGAKMTPQTRARLSSRLQQIDKLLQSLGQEIESHRGELVSLERKFLTSLRGLLVELSEANLRGLPASKARQLRGVLDKAIETLDLTDVIEGERGLGLAKGLRYNVIQPLQEIGTQFLAMNMQNMQMALMFGFSSSIFQAMTQIPMESTYQTMQPIFYGAGNLTGLIPVYRELQEFAQTAPRVMSDIQSRMNSMQALLGSRYYAESAVSKALEIARVQPIQFPEAMEILSAMAVYPSTKARATEPGFQEKIFNAVQLLSMLAPEQGVGGALFAIREMLGGQFRSLQMRFNISPEVLAAYAGKTVSEFKGAPGAEKVEILYKALETMFGGNEILFRRGAQFDVQLRNISDTLTSAIILPLVRNIRPMFSEQVLALMQRRPGTATLGAFPELGAPARNIQESALFALLPESQSKMLVELATQKTAEEVGVAYKKGMDVEAIKEALRERGQPFARIEQIFERNLRVLATQTYGTGSGMISLIATAFNTILGPLVQSLGIGTGLSDLIGKFGQRFLTRAAAFTEQASLLESPTASDQMKRKVARDLVLGFVKDLEDAVDSVRGIFSTGKTKELLRPITELMRKISMTTFQPVAEVMMAQTAKTATELPGMLLGQTALNLMGSIFPGEEGVVNIPNIIEALSTASGIGAWISMSRARTNVKGAALGVAGFSVLQAGLNQLARGETSGLLATLIGGGLALQSVGMLERLIPDSIKNILSSVLRIGSRVGVSVSRLLTGTPVGLATTNLLAAGVGAYNLLEGQTLTQKVLGGASLGAQLLGLALTPFTGTTSMMIGTMVAGALSSIGALLQMTGTRFPWDIKQPSRERQARIEAAEWQKMGEMTVMTPRKEMLSFASKQLEQLEREYYLRNVMGQPITGTMARGLTQAIPTPPKAEEVYKQTGLELARELKEIQPIPTSSKAVEELMRAFQQEEIKSKARLKPATVEVEVDDKAKGKVKPIISPNSKVEVDVQGTAEVENPVIKGLESLSRGLARVGKAIADKASEVATPTAEVVSSQLAEIHGKLYGKPVPKIETQPITQEPAETREQPPKKVTEVVATPATEMVTRPTPKTLWELYAESYKRYATMPAAAGETVFREIESAFFTPESTKELKRIIQRQSRTRLSEQELQAEVEHRRYLLSTAFERNIFPIIEKIVTSSKPPTEEDRLKLKEQLVEIPKRLGVPIDNDRLANLLNRIVQILQTTRTERERTGRALTDVYKEYILPRVVQKQLTTTLFRKGYEAPAELEEDLFKPGRVGDLKEQLAKFLGDTQAVFQQSFRVGSMMELAAQYGIITPQESFGYKRLQGELVFQQLRQGIISPEALLGNANVFRQVMTSLIFAGRFQEAQPYIRRALLSQAEVTLADQAKLTEIARHRGIGSAFAGADVLANVLNMVGTSVRAAGQNLANSINEIAELIKGAMTGALTPQQIHTREQRLMERFQPEPQIILTRTGESVKLSQTQEERKEVGQGIAPIRQIKELITPTRLPQPEELKETQPPPEKERVLEPIGGLFSFLGTAPTRLPSVTDILPKPEPLPKLELPEIPERVDDFLKTGLINRPLLNSLLDSDLNLNLNIKSAVIDNMRSNATLLN